MSDFDRQREYLDAYKPAITHSFSPKDGYEFAGGLQTVEDSRDSWPYMFGMLGETVGSSPLKFVTYCEGDVEVYTFASKEERDGYVTLFGQSDADYAEELARDAGHDIPGSALISLLKEQSGDTVDIDEAAVEGALELYAGAFDNDADYAMHVAEERGIDDMDGIDRHFRFDYEDFARTLSCDGEFTEYEGHYFRTEN